MISYNTGFYGECIGVGLHAFRGRLECPWYRNDDYRPSWHETRRRLARYTVSLPVRPNLLAEDLQASTYRFLVVSGWWMHQRFIDVTGPCHRIHYTARCFHSAAHGGSYQYLRVPGTLHSFGSESLEPSTGMSLIHIGLETMPHVLA